MYYQRADGIYQAIRFLQLLPDGTGRLLLDDFGEVILSPDDAKALASRLDYRTFRPGQPPWPALRPGD